VAALLDGPAPLGAAKTLPYIRAASESKGRGSQVAAAHCKRSWRRALVSVPGCMWPRGKISSRLWPDQRPVAIVCSQAFEKRTSAAEAVKHMGFMARLKPCPSYRVLLTGRTYPRG